MPKGKKKSHKGGHRHFTNEDALAAERAREERQKEWRRQKGIESDEEEEEVEKVPEASKGAPGDLPPVSESESSSEEEEDDRDAKKGVSHLIDIENPNRAKKATKKVTDLGDGKTELSRREREELEKQQAKANYQKMHQAGKTEEARADLARLALIRKQRDDAARKREEETKAREETKSAAEQRLLDKKKAAKK